MLAQPTFVLIQVLNSISLGMNLFIIAAGLTLIFGVLRVINFAHGAFYMIGAYVCYAALAATGSFWAGVLGAALALGALAFLVERFLLKHLYGREHLMQLLFTFALVLILGDATKLVWGTGQYSVSYPAGLDGAAQLGPAHFPQYLLFLCFLGPVVAASMWLILEKTRWGRLVRAATQDREMLAALGVNVPLVYTWRIRRRLCSGRSWRGPGRTAHGPDPGDGCHHHRRVFHRGHHRGPGQSVG